MSTTIPTRLRNSTLFYYSIADLPVMLAIMPMMLYLSRFYTGDMGLSLAGVANIMLFARVFDVITGRHHSHDALEVLRRHLTGVRIHIV